MPPLTVIKTKKLDANNSKQRNVRLYFKLAVWLFLMLTAYQILWSYWLAGVGVPDYEIDKATGQKRIRRRPDLLVKHDYLLNKEVPNDPMDGILEGFLTLINIYVPSKGLVSYNDQAYTDVKATFCSISWDKQAEDPSKVPMFRDLQEASPLCRGTTITVDLYQVTRKAMDYDFRNHTFAATPPKPGQGPVSPTAVVFHESRCGSTLLANLFSASAPPNHVRVYSESPPPVAALKACEMQRRCDAGAQSQLIRDVFYLMGRITRVERPQFVFYKIQSVGVHSIGAFTKAMPNVPWMFAYRDSVEVMMSHFKHYQFDQPQQQQPQAHNAVCLRNYQKPLQQQPAKLLEMLTEKGLSVGDLSREDYCAAHLASLAGSAVDEYQSTPATSKRWFINYNQLPHITWEKILPGLGFSVDDATMNRMQQVAHVYSKGRGTKAGQEFLEDSTQKQDKAPEVVKQAVAEFMAPVYEQMEAINAKQQ
ncbi:hypothetical protein MPSEU_000623400 [Mayamaea pseudoterrestris]|nr:hypothetical protein MPSEU_000623400 [Mayamaea pseudoterrestris]